MKNPKREKIDKRFHNRYNNQGYYPGTFIPEDGDALDVLEHAFTMPQRGVLDYPCRRRYVGRRWALVYDVPVEDKERLLYENYVEWFGEKRAREKCLPLDTTMTCSLGVYPYFRLRDYMVLHYRGKNYIVSPYFFETGDTCFFFHPITLARLDEFCAEVCRIYPSVPLLSSHHRESFPPPAPPAP